MGDGRDLTFAAAEPELSFAASISGEHVLRVTPGTHECLIVQMRDLANADEEAETAFVLRLRLSDAPPDVWSHIAWADSLPRDLVPLTGQTGPPPARIMVITGD